MSRRRARNLAGLPRPAEARAREAACVRAKGANLVQMRRSGVTWPSNDHLIPPHQLSPVC